ncbi:peroxisomal targeting signal receptor [Aspergillus luchuensis]|uniref:Peroxisomal targeting signal receptor n=1 Tax=Aspergillus kawachii TaxID=1069201 RepID=A0A146F8K7_ASPKA|nr:peroxisomal targeting signal receptor [Aspergillus luchuensis]
MAKDPIIIKPEVHEKADPDSFGQVELLISRFPTATKVDATKSAAATGIACIPRRGAYEGLQYRRIDRATGEELSPQIKGLDHDLGKLSRRLATNAVSDGVVLRTPRA